MSQDFDSWICQRGLVTHMVVLRHGHLHPHVSLTNKMTHTAEKVVRKLQDFRAFRKVQMECMLVGLVLSTDIVFSFLLLTEITITRDWLGGQKCVCVCH